MFQASTHPSSLLRVIYKSGSCSVSSGLSQLTFCVWNCFAVGRALHVWMPKSATGEDGKKESCWKRKSLFCLLGVLSVWELTASAECDFVRTQFYCDKRYFMWELWRCLSPHMHWITKSRLEFDYFAHKICYCVTTQPKHQFEIYLADHWMCKYLKNFRCHLLGFMWHFYLLHACMWYSSRCITCNCKFACILL